MRKILIALSAAGLLCSIVSCKSEDSATQLERTEKFNLFGAVIGEFNCSNGEFMLTGGNDTKNLPLGRWLSRQDLIDSHGDSPDDLVSAKTAGDFEYEMIKSSVVCKVENNQPASDKKANATSITDIKCENSFLGTPLTYTINNDSVKVVFDGNEYGGVIDGKKIRIDGEQLLISVKPELRQAVGGSTFYVPTYTCPAVLPMGIQYFIP